MNGNFDTSSPPRGGWWKTALLLAGTAVVVAAILEGGARVILAREARRQAEEAARRAAAAVPAPEPVPMKAHDMSSLDHAHTMGPGICWTLKPNLVDFPVQGRCWGHDVSFSVSTNAEGLRGPALLPPGERTRVLALGDSTTFGLGVNNDETWPAQLQAALNARVGGEQFEVLNAGVSGTSTFQALVYLDKRGLSFKPAAVLVCCGHNDFDSWNNLTDMEQAAAMETAPAAPGAPPAAETERSFSDLFALTRRAIGEAGRDVQTLIQGKRPRLTPDEYRETLQKIQELCAANGVEVFFILWPYEEQARTEAPVWRGYQEMLLEFGKTPGVHLVNLHSPFRQAGEGIYADPVHGNAQGCRVAAETIAEAVLPLVRTVE
jgi:lysophospholipase L1-like esterase